MYLPTTCRCIPSSGCLCLRDNPILKCGLWRFHRLSSWSCPNANEVRSDLARGSCPFETKPFRALVEEFLKTKEIFKKLKLNSRAFTTFFLYL